LADSDLTGINSVSWPGDPPGDGTEGHQYVNTSEPGMSTNYPGGSPTGLGNPETNPRVTLSPRPDQSYTPGPVNQQPIVAQPQQFNVLPPVNQTHTAFAQALLQGPGGMIRQVPNQPQRSFQRPSNPGMFGVRRLRWQ
jgi:hypothetical protein